MPTQNSLLYTNDIKNIAGYVSVTLEFLATDTDPSLLPILDAVEKLADKKVEEITGFLAELPPNVKEEIKPLAEILLNPRKIVTTFSPSRLEEARKHISERIKYFAMQKRSRDYIGRIIEPLRTEIKKENLLAILDAIETLTGKKNEEIDEFLVGLAREIQGQIRPLAEILLYPRKIVTASSDLELKSARKLISEEIKYFVTQARKNCEEQIISTLKEQQRREMLNQRRLAGHTPNVESVAETEARWLWWLHTPAGLAYLFGIQNSVPAILFRNPPNNWHLREERNAMEARTIRDVLHWLEGGVSIFPFIGRNILLPLLGIRNQEENRPLLEEQNFPPPNIGQAVNYFFNFDGVGFILNCLSRGVLHTFHNVTPDDVWVRNAILRVLGIAAFFSYSVEVGFNLVRAYEIFSSYIGAIPSSLLVLMSAMALVFQFIPYYQNLFREE